MLSFKLTAKRFELTWTDGSMEIKWSFATGDDPAQVANTLVRFASFYTQQARPSSVLAAGPAGGFPAPVAVAERPVPGSSGAFAPPAPPPGADYEIIPDGEQSWES